jgi:hypothetical protein
MKAIRILSCICTMALGLTLYGSLAAAQPATISCGTAIDNYFTQTSRLNVVGTRVTARGALGFSSFTMANGYEVATTPLHTPAAGAQSIFTAGKGSSYFTGPFHEVLPERGNGHVDLADFWVYRTGAFWLARPTGPHLGAAPGRDLLPRAAEPDRGDRLHPHRGLGYRLLDLRAEGRRLI